jgi:hypothetical protein
LAGRIELPRFSKTYSLAGGTASTLKLALVSWPASDGFEERVKAED